MGIRSGKVRYIDFIVRWFSDRGRSGELSRQETDSDTEIRRKANVVHIHLRDAFS